MKKILLPLAVVALLLTGYSCKKKGEMSKIQKFEAEVLKDTTLIEFLDTTTFVFDTVNEGDKVEHVFTFKNTGDKDLVIADAHGSCGCTVPEYPKEPVKPGQTGSVHVTFNSSGKPGAQIKSVTMVCNTPARTEKVYLKGYVIPKDGDKKD